MDNTDADHHPASNVKEWEKPGIFLIEMSNDNGMSLTVCNYGAAVVSCKVPDQLGKLRDVVCGYEHPEGYMEDKFFMGTVVGRYANRIKGGRVFIEGEEVRLTTTPAGFHHHGGARGFNKKLFCYQLFETGNVKGVRLTYTSPDKEEGFPGNLDLAVSYFLDNENKWTVEYEAVTDQPTIVNLTQHTYFNLAGHNSGPVGNQVLDINADSYLVVDGDFIPTGEIRSVEGTAFDFRQGLRLNERIDLPEFVPGMGYDNSWVLEKVHSSTLKYAAGALDEGTGIVLKVYTTEPSVHFYSGNFIDNSTVGKNGVVYGKRSGFCLETQHFPDSPNHPAFPSTMLRPGEKFRSKTIFDFGSRNRKASGRH